MPITDLFENFSPSPTGPATGGFDIVPDDNSDLPAVTRALMVASGGDAAVILKDGSTLTLPALVPGSVYPLRVRRVLATGTTASGIRGLY